jgi:hypothetical protein
VLRFREDELQSIDLDQDRGMAAHKAAELRRLLAEVEASSRL